MVPVSYTMNNIISTLLICISQTGFWATGVTGSCFKPSLYRKTHEEAEKFCRENNGSVLSPSHLTKPPQRNDTPWSVFSRDIYPIWYHDDDKPVCKILKRHKQTYEDKPCNCTEKHRFICVYNASGKCVEEVTYPSAVSIITTEAINSLKIFDDQTETSDSYTNTSFLYDRDRVTTQSRSRESKFDKYPYTQAIVVIIISVYISCVVIVVLGGIIFFKLRKNSLIPTAYGNSRREQDELYYPLYFPVVRAPLTCAGYRTEYSRTHRQPGYPRQNRIRNLSAVAEVPENDSDSSTKPSGALTPDNVDDDVYEMFDFHASRRQDECPLTPELYAPLLNPGEGETSVIFFSGDPIDFESTGPPCADAMRNPVYEGHSVTTRL